MGNNEKKRIYAFESIYFLVKIFDIINVLDFDIYLKSSLFHVVDYIPILSPFLFFPPHLCSHIFNNSPLFILNLKIILCLFMSKYMGT